MKSFCAGTLFAEMQKKWVSLIYIRDARMANTIMTPIRSVPTPDMTRFRLRHQVAFWKALSLAGPMFWANCCSRSAWLDVGVAALFGSRGRGRNEAIIHAAFLISTDVHADGRRAGASNLLRGQRNPKQKSRICLF